MNDLTDTLSYCYSFKSSLHQSTASSGNECMNMNVCIRILHISHIMSHGSLKEMKSKDVLSFTHCYSLSTTERNYTIPCHPVPSVYRAQSLFLALGAHVRPGVNF